MTAMSAAQIIALMREAAAEGLTQAAEHVQEVTRERTPDDPSTSGDDLRASLAVDPASPDSLEAAVSTDSPYAVYQHENLTIQHPTGQSKYLESATLESRAEAEQIIAATVRRRLA